MKTIYEESSENVTVTVLKAEYHDAPETPRYLVALGVFGEPTEYTDRRDAYDFDVIRWAQAEYDRQKAMWASATLRERLAQGGGVDGR